MKRFLPILTLLLLLPHAVLGQAPKTAGQQQLLAIENERVRALVANDFAALEQILADDLIYTHSTGVTESKAEYLGQLRSGQLKYHAMDHESVTVRLYGAAAVLTGRTKVRSVSKGQELRNDLKFTIVYAKQKGRWRMVAWQSTRVSP